MLSWIWIHRWSLWTIISPLIYGGAAWLITSRYQQRVKRFEMRWDTYREMVANLNDCFLQATRLRESTFTTYPNEQAAKQAIASERESLRQLTATSIALFERSQTLFSEKVSEPWSEMASCFILYAKDPVGTDFSFLEKEASTKARRFRIAASAEIGMPFKRSSPMLVQDAAEIGERKR